MSGDGVGSCSPQKSETRSARALAGVASCTHGAALAPELSAGLVNKVEIGAEIDAVVAALDQ